jgi:hypothetical protein
MERNQGEAMTLEQRIEYLENNLKGQESETRLAINLDDVVRKLGLDPDMVKATAKEKNQSRVEVIAAKLGVPYIDFVRELRLHGTNDRQ